MLIPVIYRNVTSVEFCHPLFFVVIVVHCTSVNIINPTIHCYYFTICYFLSTLQLCSHLPPLFCHWQVYYISVCYRLGDTLYAYHFILFLNNWRERKVCGNGVCYNYIITGALCVDLNCCLGLLAFSLMISFSISYKKGLLAVHPFNFCFSWNICILPSFLKYSSAGLRIWLTGFLFCFELLCVILPPLASIILQRS